MAEHQNYRMKPDPALFRVSATRWHKLGDHPAVTPIYGAGTRIDEACGHPSNEHGFLKTPDGTVGVCPGDWVVVDGGGRTWRYRDDHFRALFDARDPDNG